MKNDENNSIFVGNLDNKVTEEILYELFLQAGPLEEVTIPTTKGVSRNFGFVVYSHEVSVPYAIELLDKISLYGRSISLRPKQNYSVRAPPGPRMPVKERLGPPPIDNSSLRAASVVSRRYNDVSMQPKHARSKERNEDDLRNRSNMMKPSLLVNNPYHNYPSQKGEEGKGHHPDFPSNGYMKHRGRYDLGSFSRSKKPYEKSSHRREGNRYDQKHFRR